METPLPFDTPDWWARWFEIVPTWETVTIQLLAAGFVMGSYYAAEWWSKEKRRRARAAAPVVSAATQPLMPASLQSPFPAPAARARREIQQPTAARVFAANAALPGLTWRAPNIASSPAAVREVERVRATRDVSRTICGHPAVTLCGCDASAPVAAVTMRSVGVAAPARPTTTAPAFTPRPLFDERPAAFARAPLFAPRSPEVADVPQP